MKFTEFYSDDDAVSPVIGVILMVAITVILAAVIATFVLGLGDQVSNTAPQATFSFDWDGGGGSGPLTITHDGGDSIAVSELYIRGASGGDTSWGGGSTNSEVRAGHSDSITAQDTDTVRVVYESDEGGNSATLGKWTGPDA